MRTLNKLDEVKYFLDKIKNSKNEKELEFNLSAFFSSARSVTWVLQKEFSNQKGFQEWYAKKQKFMKNDSFLKSLIYKRNLSEKEGFAGPEMFFSKPKFKPTNWFMYRIENETAIFENVVVFSEKLYKKIRTIVKEGYENFSNFKN